MSTILTTWGAMAAPSLSGKGGTPAAVKFDAWQREMERAQSGNWFKGVKGNSALTTPAQVPPLSSSATVPAQFQPTSLWPFLAQSSAYLAPQEESSGNVAPTQSNTHALSNSLSTLTPIPQAHMSAGDTGGSKKSNVLVSEGGCLPEAALIYDRPVPDTPTRQAALPMSHASPVSKSLEGAKTIHSLVAVDTPQPQAAQVQILPMSRRIQLQFATQKAEKELNQAQPDGAGATSSLSKAAFEFASRAAPGARLHAQWQGDTATIWIGMDGSASQVQNQALLVLAELKRHFAGSPQRVGKLICNGQVMFDAKSGNPLAQMTTFDDSVKLQTRARQILSDNEFREVTSQSQPPQEVP